MIMASSSSSATPQVKHDVFLSFRGEDTRNNFTSYLYEALCRKKIQTFIDYQLERGDEISSSLLNTIKDSKLSVVVFSKDYASSRWCLQELEHILECKRTLERIVIPVFYHVEPLDVRNQTRTFGDAFAKLQKRFGERIEELNRWKTALVEAADISGCHVNDKRKRKAEEGEEALKKPETMSMGLTRSATRRANFSAIELPEKNNKVEPGAKRKKKEADTERLRSLRARNVAVSRTSGIKSGYRRRGRKAPGRRRGILSLKLTSIMRLTRSATRQANSSATELPKKKVEPAAKRRKE